MSSGEERQMDDLIETETTDVAETADVVSSVESDAAVLETAEIDLKTAETAETESHAACTLADEPVAAASESTEAAKPVNPNFHWYVVNAYSGFEVKAKKSLEERIRSHGLEDFFGDVYVPEETVIELVKGEKKTSTRKYFPGYMLVQMELNQDTWHLVKETPKISGFVGDATDPMPLEEEEVAKVLSQVEEGAAAPKSRITFTEGEAIKVIDGPFAEFNGTVEEVRPDKGKVRVLVSIFGRATPLDLDFVQVEKIS